MMPRYAWGIIVAVLFWYVLYYYWPPRQIAILQTTLAKFTFDLLLQRQPIVLYDRVSDWDELKRAWFPSNRSVVESVAAGETWSRNSYKYLLIQPVQDSEVLLYPPFKKLVDGRPPTDETLLSIKLKAAQILILPYRWYYCMPTSSYSQLGIHDLLTPWLPTVV
jgi:hypothetical protein